MSGTDSSVPPEQGGGDPWAAFGYLVAGIGLYGFLGWGLGRWLNAPYLTPLGIVVGMMFGLYLVFNEYARMVPRDTPGPATKHKAPDKQNAPEKHKPVPNEAGPRHDRGTPHSSKDHPAEDDEADATRPDDDG